MPRRSIVCRAPLLKLNGGRFSRSELGEWEKWGYVQRVSASDDDQKPPSLRIRELTITNFRTFVEPTTISFCDANGNADAIAVFHGDNGSGKSNALAALDLFFQVAPFILREREPLDGVLFPWDREVTGRAGRPIVLRYQDRPQGTSAPMQIEVCFADPRLERLRLVCVPSGEEVRATLLQSKAPSAAGSTNEYEVTPKGERDRLITWLNTPRGPQSWPLSIISSRRWHRGYEKFVSHSLLPNHFAAALYELRTSRNPEERNRWRTFCALLNRFKPFSNKDVSIESTGKGAELIIEDPGRTVLGLNELSSGEQQVAVLCAASLLSASAILAIEEPEISLDAKNQELLHEILGELSEKGLIDQIILESHVARFDGPNVIRFTRNDDGRTSVKREPSLDESKREVERLAKEKGAEHLWVTRDGYTKLPEKMVQDLGASSGGHVWFLKGPEHWEAWPEGHVDDLFRGGEGNGN